MRKSNIVLTAVFAIVAVILLAAWYLLGFNKVDAPLDLMLAIIWAVLLVAGCVVVARTEKARRQRVRTMYVAPGRVYNSEAGTLALAAGASATALCEGVLSDLAYGFDREDAPEGRDGAPADWTSVVRTEDYKPADEGDRGTWTGEVVDVATGSVRRFASREELAAIIG